MKSQCVTNELLYNRSHLSLTLTGVVTSVKTFCSSSNVKHVTLTSQHSRLGEFLKGLKVLDVVVNVLGQNNLSLMDSARGSHEEHIKH